MDKLKFVPPSKDEPGYPRRVRKALGYFELMTTNPSTKVMDDIIDFLLPCVKEPADRAEAREILYDASQSQFQDLLGLMMGKGSNPQSPPQSDRE